MRIIKFIAVLALALVFLGLEILGSAEKPTTLVLEKRTTLHVGEAATLAIPSDKRYSHPSGKPAGDALVFIRRSNHELLYHAVRPGLATIIITPNVPKGECISCATLHYFITVVPRD